MKIPYISAILESYKTARNNLRYFLIAVGFDLVLAVLYGFVSSAYQNKILDYIEAVGAVALSAGGVKGTTPSFLSILFNSQTNSHILIIIILFALLLASIYYMFSFLFGTSTYISFNLEQFSRKSLADFLKKMFVIMLPWIVMYAIYKTISFYYYYLDTARQTLGMGKTNFTYIGIVIEICIVYFMLISLMLEKKHNFRNSLKVGIRHLLKMFPLFLFLLAVLLFFSWISTYFVKYRIIAILYEVFIILGFIVFSRIVMKKLYDTTVHN